MAAILARQRESITLLVSGTTAFGRMAMKRLVWFAALAFLPMTGASQGQEAAFEPQWKALGELLVERMSLRTGERVLLVGQPGRFDELTSELRSAVRLAGATDLGALSVLPQPYSHAQGSPLLSQAHQADEQELTQLFDNAFDIAVMLPGAAPTHPAYRAIQDLLRQGKGRTIHFHWEGAYDLNGEALPITDSISAAYQQVLLETDYAAVSAAQRQFEKAARRNPIQVTTPSGTDIRFRIGNRPVTRQDGDASASRAALARNLIDREVELPCGAIRVAPLEESVEGVIAFPDSSWNGQRVEGLRMRFQKGRVVEISARSGEEAVEAELEEAGPAGRAFREFALGFNPLLAIPEEDPWIPYYGYGAGVVRLSLGDNSELGGKVSGGYVRWNFFADATVRVGKQVWVQDGKLTVPAKD